MPVWNDAFLEAIVENPAATENERKLANMLLMQREITRMAARRRFAELLRALDHATSCPLTLQARQTLGDEPEKITACEGCRDTLQMLNELKEAFP